MAYPVPAAALRKSEHVVIGGRPGTITDISVRADSVTLTAVDIFTKKQLDASVLPTTPMNVPNLQRAHYSLTEIVDGFLNLIAGDGTVKNDLAAPEGDLGRDMRTAQLIPRPAGRPQGFHGSMPMPSASSMSRSSVHPIDLRARMTGHRRPSPNPTHR